MIGRLLPLFFVAWAAATAWAGGVATVDYRGWKNAYRLFNSDAEVIVVPEIGRIMRYGFIGAENLLWEEGRWAGLDGGGAEWRNFGGDKIWPGPESLWRSVPYRPPVEWDARPHAVEVLGDRSIRMTSAVWAGHGLRIVREIALAETGAQVTIASRFERSGGDRAAPIFVWSITQVPAPRAIFALVAHDAEPALKNLGRVDLEDVSRPFPEVVQLGWPRNISKAGFASDALGAWRGGFLFVQRLVRPEDDSAQWEPFTRSQVFFKPVPSSPGDSAGYAELEFTSPTRSSSDRSTVIWDLSRLPSAETSPGEVLQLFRATARP